MFLLLLYFYVLRRKKTGTKKCPFRPFSFNYCILKNLSGCFKNNSITTLSNLIAASFKIY